MTKARAGASGKPRYFGVKIVIALDAPRLHKRLRRLN
jgi:hypothetical protein